jgi:rhodanese-related sulfurtransferase
MKTIQAALVSLAMVSWTTAGYAHCGKCEDEPKAAGDKKCPSGVCAASTEVKADVAAKPAEGKLNVAALAALLKSGTAFTVVDARSGKWDDGRRVPGAKSLNAESSEKEIATVLPDKKGLVVTYCANVKCGASPALAKHLKELGYENVVEFPEGIEGWAAAGQTVEKAKKE